MAAPLAPIRRAKHAFPRADLATRSRSVAMGLLFAFLALPLVALLLWSVAGSWFYPDLLPTTWSLRAWAAALQPGSATWAATLASLGIGVAATLAAIVIALPAAWALAREEFRGKRVVELLVLAPLMVPPFAIALGLTVEFLELDRLGLRLYHTWLGVVLAHLVPTLPYAIRVLQVSLEGMGRELERSAQSLGADPWRTFWHVTLPAIRPALAVAALFSFLVSFSTYLLTLLVSGGTIVTLPALLFAQLSNLNRPAAAVTAILFMTPGIVYLFVTEKIMARTRIKFEFPAG